MTYIVAEVELNDPEDADRMRRVLGANLREGDGVYTEEGRFFMILPTDLAGAKIALDRLGPLVVGIGGVVKIKRAGSDPLVDSIYRRAEARLLPVVARVF